MREARLDILEVTLRRTRSRMHGAHGAPRLRRRRRRAGRDVWKSRFVAIPRVSRWYVCPAGKDCWQTVTYIAPRERERGWDKRRRLTHGCIRWSGFGGCPGQDWVRDGRGHLPDVQLTVEGASSQARRPSRYLGRHHPRATVLGDHKDRRVTGVPAVRMRNSHPVACQGYDEEEDNQSVGAAGHDLSCRHEAGLYPCSHAAAEGL